MASGMNEDVSSTDDLKLDPSDYLPRRTSRASAHLARRALKKSLEKDTAKHVSHKSVINETTNTALCNKQELREKQNSHSVNDYKCVVQVVPCDKDPSSKDLVQNLLHQHFGRQKDGARFKKETPSDDLNLEDETLPPSEKKARLHKSQYNIVYGPSFSSEKCAFSLIARSNCNVKLDRYDYIQPDGKLEDLGKHKPKSLELNYNGKICKKKNETSKQVIMVYPKPGASILCNSSSDTKSSDILQDADIGNLAKPPQLKSLSVVIVHPKPGSKIINKGGGNKRANDASTLLNRMMEDPSVVISNRVESVITSDKLKMASVKTQSGPALNTVIRNNIKPSKQKSLSVVMVHPKPGSKIIKRGCHSQKVRPATSLINRMIADPNVVISSQVESVMTANGNFELPCNHCNVSFIVAKDLVNHKRLVHKCLSHMCVACGSDFSEKEAYEHHVCVGKFRCKICGSPNGSKSQLESHTRSSHHNMRPLMCPVCCYSAESMDDLCHHECGGRPAKAYRPPRIKPLHSLPVTPGPALINSAGGKIASAEAPDLNPEDSKKFLCEECLSMFATAEALASHACNPVDLDGPSSAAWHAVSRGQGKKTTSAAGPLGLVLPEVEQLAKFYSSVVFQDK